LNIKPIIRAAVCAALVTAFLAGSRWFTTRPVAGKETKEQTLQGAAALDRLKRDGQYDSLQAAMNQARFSVSRAEHTPLGRAAWRAPNPAAGYNAYITEAGVSIAVDDQSYASLSLSSLGYGAALRAVGPGEVYADKQTINITRDYGVREWYVNGPDGLEQGFTLSEPPGERQSGAPLRLALEVSEGWRAEARDDGQQVTLRGADGQAVEYSKLFARDSMGRDVPARLSVAEDQVVIEVEDSEAAYPLTIDPLFIFQQKLVAADGAAGDYFGGSVALDGDTLVVGASGGANPSAPGSAYVFTRSGVASWTLQQKLTASVADPYNSFGISVALDGNTLVVGASGDTIGANAGQGSAYVFTRSGGVWTEQQKLTAGDGAPSERFGQSVAVDGDTLVVGAWSDTIGANTNQGSAYVFIRDNAVWTEQQKLTASDGAAYDQFGAEVALDTDTLVVGAPLDNIGANIHQGSVYVFTRGGAVWTQQQKLTASDGEPLDGFGRSVALDAETLVVSAPYDNIGANLTQGSAYVFTRSGAVWSQQQKLTASDGEPFDYFGRSVALDADNLVVGANFDNIGPNQDQGSAYVFKRGVVWWEEQKLVASGDAYEYFGQSVALDGDTVVAGAPSDNIGANQLQGSVYVFYRPPCESLALTPAGLPNGFIDSEYHQFVRVNSPEFYSYTLSNGALPPGLSLSSNGLLKGTPTAQGTYQFTISATGSSSPCHPSRDYTITIEPPCLSLAIDPPTLLNGSKGSPYYETLTGMYGISPYTFSKKSGLLPPGLILSADGVLSGTPTKTGLFSFTLQVRDSTGCTGVAPYSISIRLPGIEFSRAPDAKRGAR
jgi:FG-GAP repeat protein/putative Ig domain-containing protein